VPYHVRITPTDLRRRQHDIVVVDKDADWIETHIATPRRRGESIFISGQTIAWAFIDEIHITETDRPSAQILSEIRAIRRARGIATPMPDEWYVAREGRDVTDRFLSGALGISSESDTNAQDPEKRKLPVWAKLRSGEKKVLSRMSAGVGVLAAMAALAGLFFHDPAKILIGSVAAIAAAVVVVVGINRLPTRRIDADASAPDPPLVQASRAPARTIIQGITHGTATSAPGRRRSTIPGLAATVAIVLIVGIGLSVYYLANNRGRIPQPSGSGTSRGGTAPASGSVDLTNNTAWNTLGKASPIIIDGHQVSGGILVPVRRHTVQLTLTSSSILRSMRMPVGLTQQSTPGLSTIAVSAGGHPHNSSHISLHPNSTGQLVLSHIGSRSLIFSLTSTTACCKTAYLGDLEVTRTGGTSSTLSILSSLEYDRSTIVESTDANPAATTTGVAGGTYPYSDAITFTLDSAGQSYMEQWFGLNDRPLNHFSTVIVVTGIGADPRKQVAVNIDANSDTVAGPIVLRPGQSKYVSVNLGGATVLRLTAESPKDSCCYVVAFGDPILKPSPG
jgi:hypothetical protein